MFQFQQDNQTQESIEALNHDVNRGFALLVLICLSVVGTSWLFSLPVYLDVKIAAEIFPVIFSVALLFLVTKCQQPYINKIAPFLAYSVIFFCWAYVIYFNVNNGNSIEISDVKHSLETQYLGMSYLMYLIGLCFISFWLGKYFKYNLILSLTYITSFIVILYLFTNIQINYLLAYALILVSISIFSAISFNTAHAIMIRPDVSRQIEPELGLGFEPEESIENDFFPPSEPEEEEIKPQLDIDVIPLDEALVVHNWELILRKLHSELKMITDVDQLFDRMLNFLRNSIEYDAAAVGMLQEKSIRKISALGSDEYLQVKRLNWSNKRVKEIFKLGEPILSTQANSEVLIDEFAEQLNRLDVPVISNQKVVGLVTLFRSTTVFNTNDVEIISSIVFHGMIALRQARLQEEVKRLSSASPEIKLTLYSREQFVMQVKPVFEKLLMPRECSLFIIEIDNFDKVIDTQGRDAGAMLFKITSKAIMSYLCERDVLGRYGNDGFVVLLDETNLQNAKLTAEKIRKKIENIKLKFQNSVLTTTVSIGLTIVSDPDEDLPSLMRKADMGLFVAKENGRNTIKVSL